MEETLVDTVAEESTAVVAAAGNSITSFFHDTLGITSFGPIIGAVVIFLIGLILIKILRTILHKALSRTRLDPTAQGFLETVVRVILWVLVLVIIADNLGIPAASLVAVVSVAGLALSLSLQNVLGNLFSGVGLLLTRPCSAGDWVDIGSVSGTVDSVGLFYTVVHTLDNKTVSIPNNDVITDAVVNYSRADRRLVDLEFSASYDAPTETVRQAILTAAGQDPLILQEPAPPFVALKSFGDSAITYAARVWCRTEDYWKVYFGMNERVREAFAAANVEMTYNHLNVHLMEDGNRPEA